MTRVLGVMQAVLLACVFAGSAAAADLGPVKAGRQQVTPPSVRKSVPAPKPYACHNGWWQTLSWGRVQPAYAVRCRRSVVES